jgi:hypothetical protein
MKEYRKVMREILKDPDFELAKTSGVRLTTKLTHIKTGALYSIHPGDKAIRPLKRWMKKIKAREN